MSAVPTCFAKGKHFVVALLVTPRPQPGAGNLAGNSWNGMRSTTMRERGFSLIEMLVVVAVFTIIAGSVFLLLNVSQQRYKMESELLGSFQTARIGMDQMMRDIHTSGYPPVQSLPAAVASANPARVAYPFAWQPSYPTTPCNVPTCIIPNRYDIIIETDIDPENPNGVEWVRYRLNGITLERGVVTKTIGADPATATLAAMLPYVENVMNDAPVPTKALIRNSYPAMFPGGASVPIFTFLCGNPAVACTALNTPSDIREVNIVLIVAAPNRDPKTRQMRVITLTGLAQRLNPS
jgi:prepilin-type N-terminal cleavage/methylation domain-containing protein